MRRSIRSAACAALALAAAPVGADVLDEFVAAQTGSFDSSLQAKHDARYDVAVWHIAEIWRDGATPERWIYTESWLKDAERPYMQRISRLSASADGSIVARRYTIPDAARFVGAWQAPERLDALSAEIPRSQFVMPSGERMVWEMTYAAPLYVLRHCVPRVPPSNRPAPARTMTASQPSSVCSSSADSASRRSGACHAPTKRAASGIV